VEAAQCWNEANALAASQMPTDYRRYDPVRHERFVGGLIETFSAELFARLAEGGARTARPVFVVGLPRSGTTLIEQLLASHSQVHGAGELRVVRRLFERLPRQLHRAAPPLACVSELDSSQTVELAAAYLRRLEEIDDARSARIVDKMPDNYLYLGFLALLFPQATFIHCRRDVRDVAVSCWSTDFRSIRWASDPQFIAARFAQHRRLMDHWRSVLPVPLYEIDYEEVVADSRTAGQRLFDWCGLPWEEQCLEFYRTKRPVRTASVRQVRQPIYSSSVGRWQRYRQTLGGLLASLEEDKPFESQSGG
jgi:hypothetical protein